MTLLDRYGAWGALGAIAFGSVAITSCSGGTSGPTSSTGGTAGTTGASAATASAGTGTAGSNGGTNAGPGPVTGCGALDPTSASTIATTNIKAVLQGAVDAAAFIDTSALFARLLNGGDPTMLHENSSSSIDSLVTDLKDKYFAAGNIESQANNSVTYRLDPSIACVTGASSSPGVPVSPPATSGSTGTSTTSGAAQDAGSTLSQSCVDALTNHPVRLVLTRVACDSGDNLHLSVQVDSEPLRPLEIDLYANRLAGQIDVGAGLATLMRLGAFSSDVTLLDNGRGHLQVALENPSSGHATFRAALPDEVFAGIAQSGKPLAILFEPSPNLFTLTADAATRAFSGNADAQSFVLTESLADFVSVFFGRDALPSVAASDSVDVHVAGLGTAIAFDGAADKLSLSGLGLGQSTSSVMHGTDAIVTIDLNADQSRKVDVDATLSAAGDVLVSVAPALDLSLGYAMAPLATLIDNLQQFARADTVDIRFDGTSPQARLIRTSTTSTGSPGTTGDAGIGTGTGTTSTISASLQVLSGALALTSQAIPAANVTVTAPQCLLSDSARTGAHEMLSQLYGGACP